MDLPFLYFFEPPWNSFSFYSCSSKLCSFFKSWIHCHFLHRILPNLSNSSLPLLIISTSALMIHIPLLVYSSHFPLILSFLCQCPSSKVLGWTRSYILSIYAKLATSCGWTVAVFDFDFAKCLFCLPIPHKNSEAKAQPSAGVAVCPVISHLIIPYCRLIHITSLA